jgi:hypothetical protein
MSGEPEKKLFIFKKRKEECIKLPSSFINAKMHSLTAGIDKCFMKFYTNSHKKEENNYEYMGRITRIYKGRY